MAVRVGVFGAGGRMGATVCAAVTADPELELVAAVDPAREGADILGLTIAGSADALAEAGAEVAVDFTVRRGCAQEPPLVCRSRGARRGRYHRLLAGRL